MNQGYYNKNAQDFFSRTVDVEMNSIYSRFLSIVPKGSKLLDAGCGSGRDSKAFLDASYNVLPLDASPELAKLASKYIGLPVQVSRFQDIEYTSEFDAIWACASLLHVSEAELGSVFNKLWQALKTGGVFYCSFKYGEGEREKEGRHFTDANEQRLKSWLNNLPGIDWVDVWQTEDQRADAKYDWINALVRKH